MWLVGVQWKIADHDILRRLRLNLFRLHAERQGISEILRLIQQGKVVIARSARPSEQLQEYLDAAVRFLSRQTRDNLPQSDILKASEEAEDFAQPGQREKLLANLGEVRVTCSAMSKNTLMRNPKLETRYLLVIATEIRVQRRLGKLALSLIFDPVPLAHGRQADCPRSEVVR